MEENGGAQAQEGVADMKTHISVQERLKDLRVEKGLKLEELAEQVGLSKSALGSYENDEDKEINHGSLLKLAGFYQVTVDYLLGLSDNRAHENTPLAELHLTDEAVALLKSGRVNNRLLCEIIAHDRFAEMLADAEIYVDGMATMRFHDMNTALAAVRAMILEAHPEAAADRYLKILEAGQIQEEDFFCHVTHKTWDAILHDIRKAHEHDIDSTPDYSAAKKVAMDIRKAIQSSGDYLGKVWAVIFNTLGLDFYKLPPDEQKILKRILSKAPNIKNSPFNFRRKRK